MVGPWVEISPDLKGESMKIAVITDSTCDLTDAELRDLDIRRVPLYIEFEGKTHRDWVDILSLIHISEPTRH